MAHRPELYGLDIETDTRVDGLDPRVSAVVTVAVCGAGHEAVFTGPERRLLRNLDQHLAALPPGVLATWNGAAFDLPFLADRARMAGVRLGLRLEPDPSLGPIGAPLPGHECAYRAAWGEHRHLDAFRLYRADVRSLLRISCSLKSIARLAGFRPVEVDRSRIHDLSREALHAYASSDARLARALAERRCPGAYRHVDQLAPARVGARRGVPAPVSVNAPVDGFAPAAVAARTA